MAEKRFDVIDDGFSKWIVDTTLKEDRHEGTLYTAYDMCHKLNELYEENMQLKKEKAQLIERLRECGMRLDRFNINYQEEIYEKNICE